jgi:GntR family transcriptional regulator, transcriptional repressor for pyruvate dehydrogenase complex
MVAPEPNSETLANTLASRIHADIVASELQEGDLFMTGDQVSERYAVSRSISREALSQLRAMGILKSRQRKGLLIDRPDPVQQMARWVPLYGRGADGTALAQLAQLRYVLELGAVDLAVPNATAGQVGELRRRAADFERIAVVYGHSADADTVDLAFHCHFLDMTGNELIAGMHRVLSDYFFASTVAEPKPGEDAQRAIREHHLIVEGIERGDRDLVRNVLRAHIEGTLAD